MDNNNFSKASKLLLLLFLMVMGSLSLMAQEICNNGKDDDNDGFIDCFDSDCSANSLCDGNYFGNDIFCQAKPTAFPKFSMKLLWGSSNKTTNHLNRASVGDLNRDGIPEVVVTEIENDFIYVLDGKTGTTKKSLKTGFSLDREIAIANINNTNCGQIFVSGGSNIYAYDCNLNLLWKSTTLNTSPEQFGIADFDGDGKIEIYCRDEVIDAHTGIRIVKGANSTKAAGQPVAVDILNNDDKLELVSGCNIYSVNLGARTLNSGSLTLVKNVPSFFNRKAHTSTSVADYNLDGSLDVIASGSDGSADANTTLFFWDVKNNVVKKYIDKIASSVFISGCSNTSGTYYKNGWQSGTGRVNIADIDDDGKLNASYVSGKYLYALDENWNLKWRVVVNEETSGYTGSTVYDFNGDGAAEVVYRDEQFLYIINGKDGSINTQQQCIARTNVEYPIVADINGDGSTELCVTCGFDDKLAWSNFCNLSYSVNSHVRVFESASLPWVPSRKLWNQHAYFNVNVNDDLTIPKVVQKHHLVWSNGTCTQGPNRPLNTFLNQTPFLDTRGCPTYASPDLINVKTLFKVNQPTCPDKNFTVTMGVQNIGDVTMIGDVPVTFYKGDPRLAGAVKLNTVNVNVNLAKGQTQTFTNLTVTGTGGAFKLFISLNDAGTSVPTPIVLPNTSIIECSYDNVIDADILPKSVKVTALKVADNIKCLGATVPNNGAARAFVSVGGVENTVDYDFFWFNGTVAGAPNFTGTSYTALAAGTYKVFARNKAQGCNSDTATVVINRVDKAPLTVAIIVDKPNSSCGIPNGQFRAVVNGGDPAINYTFKWYEGNDIFTSPEIAAGHIASNLKGGKTYTVLVTDNFSGCQVVSSLAVPDVTVTPVASASTTNALCVPANSGSASATVGGVTIGYTFSWYNGAAAKPTADFTGATYSSIPAGAYTVIATETASGCKSAPVTVNVNTPAPFTVTAAQLAPQTSCNPLTPTGSATADVGGVTVGFTFNWFKGQSTAPADAVASSTNLASGIYTVKATNTATGCSATAETTISQNLINPVVTLTPSPNAVCDPTKGTSAFTGSVTATVTYNGSVVTDFTPYQLVWHNGPLTTDPVITGATSKTISQLNGGNYTLVVTKTAEGCAAAPTTALVSNTPTLPSLITAQSPSHNCDIGPAGDGSAEVTKVNTVNVGATTNFTYQWHTGIGTGSVITGQTNPKLLNLKGGASSNFTVLVTDKTTGCQNTATVLVGDSKVLPVLTLKSTPNSICDAAKGFNGTALEDVLTDANGLGGDTYTYSWSTGNTMGSIIAGQTSSTLTNRNGGFYTATVTNNRLNCTSNPETVEIKNIQVLPAISNVLTASTNCVGGAANGQIASSVTNGLVGETFVFQWFNGNTVAGVKVPDSPNNGNTATAIQLAGGANYTVSVYNNVSGCTNTLTSTLTDAKVLPVLTLKSTPNSICDAAKGFNGTALEDVLTDANGVGGDTYTYAWSTGNTMGSIIAGQTSSTLANQNGGFYTATVTNNRLNCTSNPETVEIKNTQVLPAISNVLTASTNCVGGAANGQIASSVTNGLVGETFAFQWFNGNTVAGVKVPDSPNNGNTATAIQLAGGANYTVSVYNNVSGCTNTLTSTLTDSKVLPVLTLKSTPNSICDAAKGFNGTALEDVLTDANGVGGDTYTYSWSTGNTMGSIIAGQTSSTLTNRNGGFYTATVTNNRLNCTSNPETVEIKNIQVLPAISNVITASTNCAGGAANGQIASSVTNGLVGETFAFQWFNGSTVAGVKVPDSPNNGNTATAIQLAGGANYTVSVYNNVSGCTNTLTSTLTDSKVLPVLTLKSTPNSICDAAKGFNGTALEDVLTDANGVGGDTYTYSWSTGNTMGSIIAGQTSSTLTNRNGGFYTATVTNNRLNCTSNPETVEIKNIQVLPAISNVITASTNCAGGAANGQIASSVTNGLVGETFAFQWFNGNTVAGVKVPDSPNNGNTATAIQLAGGANYTVSVYNNVSGCENTLTSTLTDGKELPTLTLTAQPNTICDPLKAISGAFDGQVAADIVTVGNYATSVAADFEYTWDADPAVVGKRLLTNKDVGTYSVFVEHLVTKCRSAVYSAQVTTAKTLPTIITDQQGSTNCVGGTADGIAQVTNVVPNGKRYTYNWYDGNTVAGLPKRQVVNTTATTDSYSGIQGGLNGVSLFQYTVEVTVLESGCSNTEIIGVDDDSQVPVLGALVPTDNTLCTVAKNGSATVGTLTYRGVPVNPINYPDYTFVWSAGGVQGPPQTYTGLAAGSYTLTAQNNNSKCTSNPVNVTIHDNLFIPKIDVATVDQTSCDPLTPNGSVSASIDEAAIGGGAGITVGYSLQWDDLIKPASVNTASFTNLKGNQNYTITATRTATGCSNTQTVFLNETLTTPTVTVAVTNLTTCVPANGQLVATPNPAATYNFFWYNGNDALDENAVIAGANPLATTAIYSNLVPGDYTVVVQNTTSKCKSLQVIKTVLDNSPKITAVAQNTTLPADCNAFGGVMGGGVQFISAKFSAVAGSTFITTTVPLGLAVNSEVLVGRDVALSLPIPLTENNVYFIKSIAGNLVELSLASGGPAITFTSNGNGTIGDFITSGYNYQWFAGVPSPTNPALGSINYFTNPPVYSAGALASTSTVSGLATGLYTVQVTDPATGCKNFHSQTLPFIGSHAVLKITKTNSTICTPGFATGNGSIEIQIESPASAPPGTDESDYEITLKKGVAVTVPTFTGPVGFAPFFVANGTLAPGSYIVEVKETYSTFDCIIAQDVIIDSDALTPVVSLTGPIIPNTACTLAGADGRIDIHVDKDPQDVTIGTTYTIDFAPDPNAAFPLAAQPAGNYSALNLSPQTYTVTALASTGCTATKSFTVIDNPVKSELSLPDLTITEAEFCDSNLETTAKAVINQIKLVGGGAENINDYQFDWFTNATLTTNILSAIGDNSATKGGEELSNVGAPLPSQKVTNQDYWVVATKTTDLSGTGGVGCVSPPLKFRIDENKVSPQILLTPSGDPSCDPSVFQGNITVDVTTASGPGAGMLYNYTWAPNGGAGQPANSVGNSGIANVLNNLNEGLYTLTALNQATGCTSTLSTTLVKVTPPVFTVDATPTNLTNCVSPGFPFNGRIDGVQVFVDGLPGTVTDFDYVWFRSDLLPASKVLDGQNVAVPVDDQLTLATYPAIAVDKYFVKAIRKSGGAGIGCESAPLRKDILDDKVLPQVSVSSTPNDACIAPNWNGWITVKAGTTGFGVGTLYNFTWQSDPSTGVPPVAGIVVTNGTNQASVAPVAPSLLSLSTYATPVSDQIGAGDYVVRVLNQTNGCTTDAAVTVTQNTVPIAVTATTLPRTHCVVPDGSANVTGITVGGSAAVTGEFAYNWTSLFGPLVGANQNGILDAGDYTVTATKNSIATSRTAFGCLSAPVTVKVLDNRTNPDVIISSTPNDACIAPNWNGSITVKAGTTGFGAGTLYNFTWQSDPSTGVPPVAGIVVTNGTNQASVAPVAPSLLSLSTYATPVSDQIGAGDYVVRVLNQTNGCTTDATVTVTQNTVPIAVTATTLPRTHCVVPDGSANVTGITVGGSAAVTGEFAYNWTSLFGPLVGANQNGILDAGDYTVTATKNSIATSRTAFGCLSAPVTVKVLDNRTNPDVIISSTPNDACIAPNWNGSITVKAGTTGFGAGTLYNFTWQSDPSTGVPPVAGIVVTNGTNQASVAPVAPSLLSLSTYATPVSDQIGAGDYVVRVLNQTNGCTTDATVTVTQNTVPIAVTATTLPRTHCVVPDGSANVTGITVGGSAAVAGEFAYNWTSLFGPLVGANQNGILDAGDYTVTATKNSIATSRTAFGCLSAPVTVKVLDNRTNPDVIISSTPNDACIAPNWNGSITVKAGTTGFGAGTLYNFTWQSDPSTGVPPVAGIVVTNGTNQASVGPIAPSLLSLSTYATPVSDQIGAGDYVVRVLNQTNGCTTDATVTVTQNTVPIAVTATTLPRTHCVIPDGSANVTGITVGGSAAVTGEFAYNWTSLFGPLVGANQNGILDVGDYTVTATKNSIATSRTAFGCLSAPVTVSVLKEQILPTISFTSQPNTACDTNFDGQITVIASTASSQPAVANSNYDFDWTTNPGGGVVVTDRLNQASPYTTLPADRIGAGTYTIRVTNLANQCFMDASFLELSAPGQIQIVNTSKLDQLICNPDGQITVNDVFVNGLVDGNHNNFRFDWYQTSTANPTILSGANEDVLNNTNFPTMGKGIYFVTAERIAGVSLGSGCISSPVRVDIDDLHVNPLIAAATINPDLNCAGASNGAGRIQINEAAPNNFTFAWFTGDDISGAPVLTTAGVNGEIAQALEEGNYTVQVRDNASNCVSVERYTIQNNPTIVSFNSAGFTAPAITTCNLATGVPVNGSATITSILENNVAQALGSYNFVWTDATGTVLQNSNAAVLNNLSPGSYFVTATNTVSNCIADFGFNVDDKTIGTTTVTLASFIQPERCVDPKDGSLTALASGTGASYAYEWFSGDQRPTPAGGVVANTATLANVVVAPPQTDVTFTVKAINNSNNCWAVDAYTIPVIVNPVILSASTSPLTFCSADNGEAFATIANDNKFDYDYFWSNGNVVKPVADFVGNDYIGLAAGTYTVVAIDKLDNTCVSQTLSVVVTNEQVIPVVSARVLQDLTICDPTQPDGVASADVAGDVIHYTFDWFTGTTTTGVSFYTGSEVSRLAATDYAVLARENTTGCSASATVKVKENFAIIPDPTIVKISDVTSCKKDNGELSVSVGGVTKDYIFDWANGTSAPPPIDFTGEFYKDLSIGSYTVIATSRITGCVSKPKTESIKKDQIFPKMDFLIQNASCTEANGFITILVQDDLPIDSVTWLQNGAVIAVGPNLQNALSGTYQVSIITTEGCEVIQDIFLPADIQPFNGVSRTNDNLNDFFTIDCIENFPNNHVEIYNRAGTKVYEADGYNNLDVIFEGKSNQGISIMGTNLPAGTYYYVISKGDGSNRLAGYLELVD